MNESKMPESTPEQLLQVLELQLQVQRAQRQRNAGRRTAIRVGGVLLILGMAIAALLILQYAMSEFSQRDNVPRGSAGPKTSIEANF